jgi:hypothetical protein
MHTFMCVQYELVLLGVCLYNLRRTHIQLWIATYDAYYRVILLLEWYDDSKINFIS